MLALPNPVTEFSTPFINIRYYQLETGSKGSKLYVANALVMSLAFWVVRVMIMPAQWALAYGNTPRLVSNWHWWPGVCIVTGMTAVTFLNLLWFYMIIQGFMDRYLLVGRETTEFEVVRTEHLREKQKAE